MENKFLCPPKSYVNRDQREAMNGHKSFAVWLTGLSGSGKSTIAHLLEQRLHEEGIRSYVLDGDNVRRGLCSDLSFTPVARRENMRRIGELVRLYVDAGILCICAFISPLREDRAMVREIIGAEDYTEVFVSCPVELCEQRDVKGYYRLAREGKIKNYTGVSALYEPPLQPCLHIPTEQLDVCQSVELLYTHLHPQL